MSCGKMQYRTKALAESEVRRVKASSLRNRTRSEYKKLRAYECCFCDGYHLTSLSKKESKQVTKRTKARLHNLSLKPI